MRDLSKIALLFTLIGMISACGGSSSAPTVPSTQPIAIEDLEGSSEPISVKASFQKTFDAPIVTATVTEASFFAVISPDDCDTGDPLASSVSCESSTVCDLTLDEDLPFSTECSVCLTDDILDLETNEPITPESYTFTTEADDDDDEIPDVSGIYLNDGDDCYEDIVLASDSGDTYVIWGTQSTLTMDSATECTVGFVPETSLNSKISIKAGDWDGIPSCSYADEVFTFEVTEGEESCTTTLTKSDAVCGNGTCEVDEGEHYDICKADCSVEVTDISFMDDANWGTTSPANDCLAGMNGNDDIELSVEPEPGMEESYSGGIGSSGYFIRVSREFGDDQETTYCHIRLQPLEGEVPDIYECAYDITACSAAGIVATCLVDEDSTCSLSLDQ